MRTDRTLHILMADDDADDQYLVKKAISEINPGYRFSSVHNGQQLLSRLQDTENGNATQDLPDCILLDLNMPLLDGFSVLPQIKQHHLLSRLPVFVLSTSRLKEDMERSISLGADGFYIKPPRYQELRNILVEICGKACHAETSVASEADYRNS